MHTTLILRNSFTIFFLLLILFSSPLVEAGSKKKSKKKCLSSMLTFSGKEYRRKGLGLESFYSIPRAGLKKHKKIVRNKNSQKQLFCSPGLVKDACWIDYATLKFEENSKKHFSGPIEISPYALFRSWILEEVERIFNSKIEDYFDFDVPAEDIEESYMLATNKGIVPHTAYHVPNPKILTDRGLFFRYIKNLNLYIVNLKVELYNEDISFEEAIEKVTRVVDIYFPPPPEEFLLEGANYTPKSLYNRLNEHDSLSIIDRHKEFGELKEFLVDKIDQNDSVMVEMHVYTPFIDQENKIMSIYHFLDADELKGIVNSSRDSSRELFFPGFDSKGTPKRAFAIVDYIKTEKNETLFVVKGNGGGGKNEIYYLYSSYLFSFSERVMWLKKKS